MQEQQARLYSLSSVLLVTSRRHRSVETERGRPLPLPLFLNSQAGLIPRIFCAANDVTSAQGPVWRPKQVVVLCHGHDGYGWRQHRSRGCALPAVLPGEQDRKHLQGEGQGLDDRGHIPGAGGECGGVAVVGLHLTAGIGVVGEGGPEASAAAGAAAARATAVQTTVSPPAAASGQSLPQPPLLQSSVPCSTGGGSSGDGLPELVLDSTSVWQRFTGKEKGLGLDEAPGLQMPLQDQGSGQW